MCVCLFFNQTATRSGSRSIPAMGQLCPALHLGFQTQAAPKSSGKPTAARSTRHARVNAGESSRTLATAMGEKRDCLTTTGL